MKPISLATLGSSVRRDEQASVESPNPITKSERIRARRYGYDVPKGISVCTGSLGPNGYRRRIYVFYAERPSAECKKDVLDLLSRPEGYFDTQIVLVELREDTIAFPTDMSDFIEKILDWLSGSRQDRPPADQLKWGFGALRSVLTKAIVDKPGIRGSQDLKIDDTTARTDYTFCFPPVSPGSAHSDPRYCFVAQVINLEQTNDSEASRSIVLLQSSVENPHSFYKDVREYAGTLDSVPSGGSFAIMATMARYSYEAWESYNVASEASARLLWTDLAENRVRTIDDMETVCQDLVDLEERLQHANLACQHNHQISRFLSRQVLTAIWERSKRYDSASDVRRTASKVRDDLYRIDELDERLSSLKASLRRIRQLYDDRRQLALVRNSFDALKMEYISQNYIRVAAFLVILFLPGIFISTLIGSRVIDTSWDLSSYWLAIALPIKFVIVGSLCVMCCFPGLTLGGSSCYRAVATAFRIRREQWQWRRRRNTGVSV